MTQNTYFAPARLTQGRDLEAQISRISTSPVVDTILTIASGLLLVLNEDRQVVAVNHGLAQAMGIKDIRSVLGLRPGQLISCIHAEKKPAGCGTTPHCVTCGAAIAIMACLEQNTPSEQVCHLTRDKGGLQEDISMQVRVSPIDIHGQRWLLFFARDITREQFWTHLEQVFFHDVNNMLTALSGNSQLLRQKFPENHMVRRNHKTVLRLCREMALQQVLSHRKDDRNMVRLTLVSVREIQEELHLILDGHPALRDRVLTEKWPPAHIRLKTDILLVSKILGNMVINALEATPRDGKVGLTASTGPNAMVWEVRNPGHIPEKTQKRIFQRYFSTKADIGRGLGTYSMKLFGEDYLSGRISFTSDPEQGTCFRFELPS